MNSIKGQKQGSGEAAFNFLDKQHDSTGNINSFSNFEYQNIMDY
jgi:hypothetical protein